MIWERARTRLVAPRSALPDARRPWCCRRRGREIFGLLGPGRGVVCPAATGPRFAHEPSRWGARPERRRVLPPRSSLNAGAAAIKPPAGVGMSVAPGWCWPSRPPAPAAALDNTFRPLPRFLPSRRSIGRPRCRRLTWVKLASSPRSRSHVFWPWFGGRRCARPLPAVGNTPSPGAAAGCSRPCRIRPDRHGIAVRFHHRSLAAAVVVAAAIQRLASPPRPPRVCTPLGGAATGSARRCRRPVPPRPLLEDRTCRLGRVGAGGLSWAAAGSRGPVAERTGRGCFAAPPTEFFFRLPGPGSRETANPPALPEPVARRTPLGEIAPPAGRGGRIGSVFPPARPR